ncbi:hypothetical protein JHK84_027373 [Glycine max]|uniref:Uncharacterized protein n=2 Tax=Glycine soja TaxID=3848 RepID=A0A0B2QZW3_GLYSO|nr:hypothetical protein JHK84_027373 [Glycine max]KHN25192.1 hypothetical protein glysoja_044789 [Glycine soja]
MKLCLHLLRNFQGRKIPKFNLVPGTKKKVMVQELGSSGLYGLEVKQPVIPPLSRARGDRCSVKPASRNTPSSRNQETCAFAQTPWFNSQLGAGRPAWCSHQPNLINPKFCSITLVPPLGL